jgi:hypothetical protein
MGAVFFGILASLGNNMRTSSGGDRAFFLVVGAAVFLINGGAFLAYRSRNWRGFGIGLWIGFGLAILVEGACFGLGKI